MLTKKIAKKITKTFAKINLLVHCRFRFTKNSPKKFTGALISEWNVNSFNIGVSN